MTSSLPGPVQRSVEDALEEVLGRPTALAAAAPLGGGCIHPAVRLRTTAGDQFFLKWSEGAPAGMFEAEADGLRALGARGAVRIPGVVAVRPSWLLLEFVPPGRPGPDWAERLGHGVATLHEPLDRPWGWAHDNVIGALPQPNAPCGDWPTFWRERRLDPQLSRARSGGFFSGGRDARILDDLLDRLDLALPDAGDAGASLLHGDLWSGNVYPGPGGEPVLVDPAVYRGHGEVDLAMSELFGGFPRRWLDAYGEVRPLTASYRRVHRPVYQLYYLLVHVNLFGGGYVGSALAAAREALAAL